MSVVSAPAAPHPIASQLAALHRFRIYVEIAVVVVVLALTNLVAHFTTPWASVATVPAAGVGPRTLEDRRRLCGGGSVVVADRRRRRRDVAVDAADVHERPLRDSVRSADRVDGDHSAADRDPRGARVPRGA